MSAERLIDLIEEQQLLPERLLAKLRVKIEGADEPMTAAALANFLVMKSHLTQPQAEELQREATAVEPTDTPGFALAKANAPDEDSSDVSIGGDGDSTGYDSSIFTPAPTRRSEATEDGGEFELLPTDSSNEISDGDGEVLEVAPLLTAPGVVDLSPLARHVPSGDAQVSSDSLILLGAPPTAPERVEEESPPPLGAVSVEAPTLATKRKKPRREKRWDSPLMLMGGGALMLMLLCGGAVWMFLNWESGDQKLRDARAARDAGSYSQAIQRYEDFLSRFKRHTDWSAGRVELGVLRIRQALEGRTDAVAALELTKRELAAMENESGFAGVRNELAGLLPQLARDVAAGADSSRDDLEAAERFADACEDALELCRTAKYVPKALRDNADLKDVEETLGRVRQRRETQAELQTALTTIKSAASNGDTRAAYATHKQLLRQHPELSTDAQLATAIVETATAEKSAVKFVDDRKPAETNERPTPWVAMLATGNRKVTAESTSGGVYCASIDGALYAIDVQSGKLLWRRYVGFGNSARPVVAGGHVLVTDSRHDELMRLDARSGKLIWRQAIGEQFALPLAVGNRLFLAAGSGRLYVVDLESGEQLGYLQFAQPLKVTPVATRNGDRLYLTGDHSCLYAISPRDLTCIGVYYLGHASGSIRVPPALVINKLAVVENDGVATCRLRLFTIGEDGAVAVEAANRRLTGLAAAAPLVSARRLIVITDRGELGAFDVASEAGAESLTLVATREPTSQAPVIRHVLMTPGAIWVGDDRLTKHAVVPTGNRLPAETIDNSFSGDTFDHPLGLFGDTIVCMRRPSGRAGAIVTALDNESGRVLWENTLAVPPAAAPVADDATRTIAVADVNGLVFRFDEQALRSRVQDQPLSTPPASRPSKLTFGMGAGDGGAVFASPGESDQLLIYSPTSPRQSLQWHALPSPLACGLSLVGKGLVAPLEVGQVFYLDPNNGQSLAAPFQPRLQPGRKITYHPAAQTDDVGREFVIADNAGKIYLVAIADQPSATLQLKMESDVGPYPVASRLVVLGHSALAVTESGQLARFELSSLENSGETDLSAEVVWGPYRAGEFVLVATANEELAAIDATGKATWKAPLAGGDVAGVPLVSDGSVLIAYRSGKVEKRSLADGTTTATLDLEHPLDSGPVRFLGRIVLTAHDGTLLVVNEP